MEALILQVLVIQSFLKSKINELYSLLPPAATNAPLKRDQLSSGSSKDTPWSGFIRKDPSRDLYRTSFPWRNVNFLT